MPQITPKMELLVNLNKPVEEIKECIMAIVNSHPGQQLELLQQVDLWLGEVISNIEKSIVEKVNEGAETDKSI